MNLETIEKKRLTEIEQLASLLLVALKRAHLREERVYKELESLRDEAERIRRERFDAEDHGAYYR